MRWTGVGQEDDQEWRLFYSGGESHNHGVGVLVKKELAGAVETSRPVSDRILFYKNAGVSNRCNIIQMLAPTTDHDEHIMIDSFYQKLEEVRKQTTEDEVIIIMEDMNAKVGEGGDGHVVGGFGLGVRNERRDRLLKWCGRRWQVILNSWYRQHPRYIWT